MSAPGRTVLIGVVVIASSVMLIASPLFLGVNVISKTVVAFGLLALVAGLSFILHGVWDWIAHPPSHPRREG